MSEWPCPRCGSTEHSVPVWEQKEMFATGQRPDYIGCLSCREMEEL